MHFFFSSMGFLERTDWLLTTLTDSICPVVTVFSWILLPQTYDQLFFHMVNCFFVTLDLVVTAKPVRLCHMIYPSFVILVYMGICQLCWQISGQNGVIPILNGRENHYILLAFIEGLSKTLNLLVNKI